MKKADEILTLLRQDLAGGLYRTGDTFPSEYELAERFGVNNKTVNKAVTLLCAEGLLERGRRGQGTRVTGNAEGFAGQIVFVGNVTHVYYANLFAGIECAAYRNGYQAVLFSPPFDMLSGALKRLAATTQVKGVVSCLYGELDFDACPVVYAEDIRTEHPVAKVVCDSYGGARGLMSALLERGHRDVAIFFCPELETRRLDGFHDAMRTHGITDFRERTFRSMEPSGFDALNILKKILAAYPSVTAIATGSDDDACRLYKALEQLNRRDITLTGFGNVPGISSVLPIAGVDQHPRLIGMHAVTALLRQIESRTSAPITETLDVELTGLHHIPIRTTPNS